MDWSSGPGKLNKYSRTLPVTSRDARYSMSPQKPKVHWKTLQAVVPLQATVPKEVEPLIFKSGQSLSYPDSVKQSSKVICARWFRRV